MTRPIAYQGSQFTIAFARQRNGECPGQIFFDSLALIDQVKLLKLFQFLGDHGKVSNPEHFGRLKDGLFEFKCHQVRMPFAYAALERGLVLISHGFRKKKNKAPPEEIARAQRILREDQEGPGLALVAGRRTP